MEALQEAFQEVSTLYIADGHHRAAATLYNLENLRVEDKEIPRGCR